MPKRPKYTPGSIDDGTWAAQCDLCGFKLNSRDLSPNYLGLMLCVECWYPQHPSELIVAKEENITPPWTRPVIGVPTELQESPITDPDDWYTINI